MKIKFYKMYERRTLQNSILLIKTLYLTVHAQVLKYRAILVVEVLVDFTKMTRRGRDFALERTIMYIFLQNSKL